MYCLQEDNIGQRGAARSAIWCEDSVRHEINKKTENHDVCDTLEKD
jgi:hypothetical protein